MALQAVNFRPGDVHISNVRMNWAAVIEGTCLTLGFGLFFLFLGNAIGLNFLNTVRTDIGSALKFFSWLYMAVTFVASYAIGAYFCSHSNVIDTQSSGIVHGLTTWALSSVVFVAIATIASIGMRILLAGLASNSANWLALCIVGVGAVASVVSGYMAKRSVRAMAPTDQITGRRVA